MAVELKVTNFGKALLIKALNNECPIMFTSMKFGSGDNPETYLERTDLVNPVLEAPITAIEKGANFVQLSSAFMNKDVEADFEMTEIGVFAMDQDGINVSTAFTGEGISAITVDTPDFLRMVGWVTGDYTFTRADGSWMFNGTEVQLASYGIGVIGEAADGDTITGTVTIAPSNLGTRMFAYINQDEDPEPIYSARSSKVKENKVSVIIIVDDAENVSAAIRSMNFVSQAQFDDHIHNYNNPHRVTKEQVGLGNVPNLGTNDLQPEFQKATTLSELVSGERLSDTLGKIAKAISDFIAHINNRSNPHKVTAAQAGAAAINHKHSAADFNSGTMNVERGGTGKTSWTANAVVYASGTSELSQIQPPKEPSVLAQTSDGAPYFMSIKSLSVLSVGNNPPDNYNLLWLDTTPEIGGLKYYNGSKWAHVPVAYAK